MLNVSDAFDDYWVKTGQLHLVLFISVVTYVVIYMFGMFVTYFLNKTFLAIPFHFVFYLLFLWMKGYSKDRYSCCC